VTKNLNLLQSIEKWTCLESSPTDLGPRIENVSNLERFPILLAPLRLVDFIIDSGGVSHSSSTRACNLKIRNLLS